MMVRGSMRSWTWRETVGTSKEVCLFFAGPDELGIEMWVVIELLAGRTEGREDGARRCGAWEWAGRFSGVTRPTGGLLTRFFVGVAYCSMGAFWIWVRRDFSAGLGFGTRALPGKLETRRQKLESDGRILLQVGREYKGSLVFRW